MPAMSGSAEGANLELYASSEQSTVHLRILWYLLFDEKQKLISKL